MWASTRDVFKDTIANQARKSKSRTKLLLVVNRFTFKVVCVKLLRKSTLRTMLLLLANIFNSIAPMRDTGAKLPLHYVDAFRRPMRCAV